MIKILFSLVSFLILAPAIYAGTGPAMAPLGEVPEPADNRTTPAKAELGKLLFFDPRLGGDKSTSCAECHSPNMGWQDNQPICRGYPGTEHWRNCQTIMNSAYYAKLFWEGNATSLEGQAHAAASGAVAGNGEDDMMEERLAQVTEYVKRFKDVFGTERPQLEDAWKAIAAFERTLVQKDTPFDRYLKGDKGALTPQQQKGLALFAGKGRCLECHNGPLLSDQKYYNLGVPENDVFMESPLHQITFRFEQYAKGVPEEVYRKTKTDLGLYYQTKDRADMGKFRTPSLRYLKYTAPYMHNGTFFDLAEVVDFYDRGGGEDAVRKAFGHGTKSEKMKPLGLAAEEKMDLIAFLESMSGGEIKMETPVLPKDDILRIGRQNGKPEKQRR